MVAVVSRGVIPAAPIAIDGDTVPDHRIAVAPPPVLPVEKCVIVVPAAPDDGKSIFAAGLVLPALDDDHPVERATFCRA